MFIHHRFFLIPLTSLLLLPHAALAHGFAGQRFFPATLTTDDPFVADELSLPTLSTIRTPDGGGTREFDASIDLSKRITPYLDVEIGVNEINLFPHTGSNRTGFGNLSLGSKFQAYTNEPHELILSLGVDIDVGGTGSRLVGRDPFTTWSPGVFFGKGFGDLPASLPFLRPFALTGNVSVDIPSNATPASVETDFALEYSLIYLQEHVRDVGLRAPFNRLIPLVEFVIDTPVDRGQGGLTTGTVNPGLIWSGRFCQFGMEAIIPLNERSGHNVGVLGQLHFYLDDLFPHSLGRPLFGGSNK